MARRKREIIALDAETDPFTHGDYPAPFVWGIADKDSEHFFWGDEITIKKQLLAHLATYPKGSIVYAHNGGKFDFHFLLDCLDPELLIVNGRIAKATILDGHIELRDSYMIIPIPLGVFDKFEIDYNLFKKDKREKNKKEIIKYLRQDCRVLLDLCTAFIERFGLNFTLAGTALKELKKTGYDVPQTSQRYDDKFRQFYYGGRVEVFKAGSFYAKDKPFEYADINSAYSKAMINNHWYGTQYFSDTVLPEKDKLGACLVTIKAVAKRCLPFRGDDNKLYFPNDDVERIYNVTGWEIIAGLDTGTLNIIEVINCYRPLLTENFKTYIQGWFDEKAANKGVCLMKYTFAKLMQNAGYGKFGQDGRRFSKFCIVPLGEFPELRKDRDGEAYDLNDGRQWQFHSDTETGQTFYKHDDPSDRFFNVPVASSITGWVRAYLFRHIHASKGVMYCDTDSIICEKFVGDVGDKLGEWEIEALCSEVHVAQRKMYAMRLWPHSEHGPIDKTKVASKGVRLSYDQIKNGVQNKSIVKYERDAPSYSVRFGQRFISRNIDFSSIEKSIKNNPEKTCI